jgi:ribosomal-protein-alanine N-acetyltransferase
MPLAGWPARLGEGPVSLRPLRLADAPAWARLRATNRDWLRPWEATPAGGRSSPAEDLGSFLAAFRHLRRQARRGTAMPFAVTYDGVLAGQVTVFQIVRGSLNAGVVSYWVDERLAGRGVIPTALALVVDHCFTVVGLHRLEANIRPENIASRRVVAKLGFREEGVRERFLHIDGAYRDHICYALTAEEGLVLPRWRAARARVRG